MNILNTLLGRLTAYMERLSSDGGPSVTRWVYVRVGEVTAWGWLAMACGAVYRYVRFGAADPVYCGMVLTLGAALFKFAQQTQSSKLAIDAQSTNPPSTVTSGLVDSTVTRGAAQ